MVVTLDLPEDIANALLLQGDLTRRALESLAVESFRQELLSQVQVGRLLGLSRVETEDFLAKHVDLFAYDPADLSRETAVLKDYSTHSSKR